MGSTHDITGEREGEGGKRERKEEGGERKVC